MTEEIDILYLSDGRRIVAVSREEFDFMDIAIQLWHSTTLTDEFVLPYPSRGLGGGNLLLSPIERFALLSIYSGQSEEGYELFRIDHGVTRVGGLSYQYGEAATYCFSPDETLLVMALPFDCLDWWEPWEYGETEPDGFGRQSFGFGQLRIHNIESGNISVHEVRISVPEDWQPVRADYDPELRPRFLKNQALGLSMPWGDIELSFPLANPVVLHVNVEGCAS